MRKPAVLHSMNILVNSWLYRLTLLAKYERRDKESRGNIVTWIVIKCEIDQRV